MRRWWRLRRARGEPIEEPVLLPYAGPERPVEVETSVVLCFRDGTAAALDPLGPHAAALQTLAVRLRGL